MPAFPSFHRIAGRLASAAAIVACSAVMADDRIALIGGDVVHGTIVEQTEENIIFEHAVLGRMVIERTKIESITLEGEEPAASTPQQAQAEGQAEAAAAGAPAEPTTTIQEQTPAPNPWKSRFEAGFNGSHGRTEKLDARLTFATERRTDETRLALDANYRTATSRGDRTQNKFDAGGIHDWYFPESPWLAFVQGRLEYDEFAAYDQRYSAGGGLGYTFVKDDKTELVGRVGLGGSLENGGPNDGEITPEGILKLDLTHHFSEITSIVAGAEYYPDLSEFGDYRAVLSAAIETKLSVGSPASLKFGVRQEFEEYQDSDREDLLEFFGLFVVEF